MNCSTGEYEFSPGAPPWSNNRGELRAAEGWVFLQQELACAFKRLARDLQSINSKGKKYAEAYEIQRNVTADGTADTSAEFPTGLKAVRSLIELCSSAAFEAERLSKFISEEVVPPVSLAVSGEASESSGASSLTSVKTTPTTNDIQKATKRLQLAEEELSKAEASLQELRNVFGTNVNGALEQKATQRVARALKLKAAAEADLDAALRTPAKRASFGTHADEQRDSWEVCGFCLSVPSVNTPDGRRHLTGLSNEENGNGGASSQLASSMALSCKASAQGFSALQRRVMTSVVQYSDDISRIVAALGSPWSEAPLLEDLPIAARIKGEEGGVPGESANTATMRNLLKHQGKKLQELQVERERLVQESKDYKCQLEELRALLATQQISHAASVGKTDCIDEVGFSTHSRSQGGEDGKLLRRTRGELKCSDAKLSVQSSDAHTNHSAEGAVDFSTAVCNLQLPVVSAESTASAEEEVSASPPAASPSLKPEPTLPVELAWLRVQLKYEAFLLALRQLPLAALTLNAEENGPCKDRNGVNAPASSRPAQEHSRLSSCPPSKSEPSQLLGWANPGFASFVASAVEAAAGAALPPFLSRCCRLSAATTAACRGQSGISVRSEAKATVTPGGGGGGSNGGSSRMSVSALQAQIEQSRRQQQVSASKGSSGCQWVEDDLQLLAYELLLLAVYQQSQYAATAALLQDLEEQDAAPLDSASQNTPSRNHPSETLQLHPPLSSQSPLDGSDKEAHLQTDPQTTTTTTTDSRARRRHRSVTRTRQMKFFGGGDGWAPASQVDCSGSGSAPNIEGNENDNSEAPEFSSSEKRSAEATARFAGHPFSLPLEEWKARFGLSRNKESASSPRVSLKKRAEATERWLAASPLLQQSNYELLLKMTQLVRVAFEIPSSSSSKLLRLLLPSTDAFWEAGSSVIGCHVFDLRFRVVRLTECWRNAFCSAALGRSEAERRAFEASQPGGAGGSASSKLRGSFAARRKASWSTRAAGLAAPVRAAETGVVGILKNTNKLVEPGAHAVRGALKRAVEKKVTLAPVASSVVSTNAVLGSASAREEGKYIQSGASTQRQCDSGLLESAALPLSHVSPSSSVRPTPPVGTDPVFRSFVARQLQLLHGAALLRCLRFIKFLLPPLQEEGAAVGLNVASEVSSAFLSGEFAETALKPPLTPPPQPEQCYARECEYSEEAALLFFLRSLICGPSEESSEERPSAAPAFLLYSQREAAAAVASAAAHLDLLPLRLLCCLYHILACIFALQQLHRQQLWGCQEALVSVEELSLLTTKEESFSVAAGSGESSFAPSWRLRCERRQRGGLELLQLLLHHMTQAALLDSALRASLAKRGERNAALQKLAGQSTSAATDASPPASKVGKRVGVEASSKSSLSSQFLHPLRRLLEVPGPASSAQDALAGDISDASEAAFSPSPSDTEVGVSNVTSSNAGHGPSDLTDSRGTAGGGGRSLVRHPTLSRLRKRTLRHTAAGQAEAAAAALLATEEKSSLDAVSVLPREVLLNPYWTLDVPLLMALLLLLGRCCTDTSSSNGLHVEAPKLAHGLLLVAHASRVGTDPSMPSATSSSGLPAERIGEKTATVENARLQQQLAEAACSGSGLAGVSTQSLALLLAACVWSVSSSSSSFQPATTSAPPLSSVLSHPSGDNCESFLEKTGEEGNDKSYAAGSSLLCVSLQRQLLSLLQQPHPTLVKPTSGELASAASELLIDFPGFLKRQSAEASSSSSDASWLLQSEKEEVLASAVPSVQVGVSSQQSSPLPAESTVPKNSTALFGRSATRKGTAFTTHALDRLQSHRKGVPAVAPAVSSAAPPVSRLVLIEEVSENELLHLVRAERLVTRLPTSVTSAAACLTERGRGGRGSKTTFSSLVSGADWATSDWWVSNDDPCQAIRAAGEEASESSADWLTGLRPSLNASRCFFLSLLLPSRVELEQQELASVQLLGASFLTHLQRQMQDYRRHFEPQVLPSALNAWRVLLQQLLMVDTQRDSAEVWLPSLEGRTTWKRRTLDALTALHENESEESGERSFLSSEWTGGAAFSLSRSAFFGGGSFESKTSAGGEEFSVLANPFHAASAPEHWQWVASLPSVLRGPSLFYDLQRAAVFQTLGAAASRCLSSGLAAARSFGADRGSASWKLREIGERREGAVSEEMQQLLAESELEQGRLLDSFERGVRGMVVHIQSELLLYSDVFEPLLPLRGEHALLVLVVGRALLASALRQLLFALSQPLKKGTAAEVAIPLAAGGKLMDALETFEKLENEVRLGQVTCVPPPTRPPLLNLMAPLVLSAFCTRLRGVQDLLLRALTDDTFVPVNPPGCLYSEKLVDAWALVHGALDAAFEANIPVSWMVPSFLHFVAEFVSAVCKQLTDPRTPEGERPGDWGPRLFLPLMAALQLQKTNFEEMLQPKGRVQLLHDSGLVSLVLGIKSEGETRSKKSRRSLKWNSFAGKMNQLVNTRDDDPKHRSEAGSDKDDASDASSDFEDSDSRHSVQIQKPHHHSSHLEGGGKGRSKSVFHRLFGARSGREEVGSVTGAGNSEKSIDISPMISCRGDQRISGAISNLLYAIEMVDEWEDARCADFSSSQQRAKGVQRWLVRLHNVSMCSKRLPELTSRLLSEVERRVVHRCPRNKEVMQHLFSLQRRLSNNDKNTTKEECEALEKRLQQYQEEELEEMRVLVGDTTQRLTARLQLAGKEICKLAAAHTIYFEFQADLFGGLYVGDDGFQSSTVERFVQAFPNTVENFFCASPLELQDSAASAFLQCFVEAWCLLLTEWGYSGHRYTQNEVEIIEQDLDCLRQYAAENDIVLELEDHTFERINDFIVMLHSDGQCLAEAESKATRHQQTFKPQSPKNDNSGVDPSERSRRGLTILGLGDAPVDSSVGPDCLPSYRRGVGETDEKMQSRRSHSRSKGGWGGVSRWMRGVYGTSTHRENSRKKKHEGSCEEDPACRVMEKRSTPAL